jgi:hypothetical protein
VNKSSLAQNQDLNHCPLLPHPNVWLPWHFQVQDSVSRAYSLRQGLNLTTYKEQNRRGGTEEVRSIQGCARERLSQVVPKLIKF